MVDKDEAISLLHKIFGGDSTDVPSGLESLHLSVRPEKGVIAQNRKDARG